MNPDDKLTIEHIEVADKLRRCGAYGGVYIFMGHDGHNSMWVTDFDSKQIHKEECGSLDNIFHQMYIWHNPDSVAVGKDVNGTPLLVGDIVRHNEIDSPGKIEDIKEVNGVVYLILSHPSVKYRWQWNISDVVLWVRKKCE